MEINKEQAKIIIGTFEELIKELSNQSKGTLFTDQFEVLEHLKSNTSNCKCAEYETMENFKTEE